MENSNHGGNDVKLFDSQKISLHALERFAERWEILTGEPLLAQEVFPKLQEIIDSAEPEAENPALLKRKQGYGETADSSYFTIGPWRLVWRDNYLVTIELKRFGSLSKPQLYQGEVSAEFYLRITEEVDNATLLEKSFFKNFSKSETLLLYGKPEVNAIILFLRFIGAEVEYRRTGSFAQKQAVLKVFWPKELRCFQIKETAFPRKCQLVFGDRDKTIGGIAPDDYQNILSFVSDSQ